MVLGSLKPQVYYRHLFQRKRLKCEANSSLRLLNPLTTFPFSACFRLFACNVNASCSYAGEGAGVIWKNAAGSFHICLSEGINHFWIHRNTRLTIFSFYFPQPDPSKINLVEVYGSNFISSSPCNTPYLGYFHNNLPRTGINWTIISLDWIFFFFLCVAQ